MTNCCKDCALLSILTSAYHSDAYVCGLDNMEIALTGDCADWEPASAIKNCDNCGASTTINNTMPLTEVVNQPCMNCTRAALTDRWMSNEK